MIFLDLRTGVTLSLLLKSAAETRADGVKVLNRAAGAGRTGTRGQGPLAELLGEAWQKATIDAIILALQSSTAAWPPLTARQAVSCPPGDDETVRETVALAGIDLLDPFEFSAYISLTILLRHHDHDLKLLIPRIGSDSNEQAFSILKNSSIIISPAAPAVSPLCAAVTVRHFRPFFEETPSGAIESVLTVNDPLHPTGSARAYYIRDAHPETDQVIVIQANIDDMTPEILAQAARVILEKGALDVIIVPALMKKGRPGFLVEVLARPGDRKKMEELLLEQTTTFGVRSFGCSRRVLDRRVEDFTSSFGRVRVKRGYVRGKCLRSVPEYEDVAALSEKIGIPLLRLYTDIQNEIARAASREGRSGKESV